MIARVDRLLPVERQAIGVFGDGDLGQKRFRRNASFNDMGRGRRLEDAVRVLEGMASTMAFNISTSFGRLRSGGDIDPTRAHFAPFLLPFQATDSLRRSAFTQQSLAA
ncbi:hypothetical protein ACVILL_001070 [Bradyrhizobium sp. USDA 3364]